MATAGAQKVHAIFKVKAEGRSRLIVFDTQDLTLGRSPENDLAIDDPEISRKHCVFKRTPAGCVVEDMGTSNGTGVNGESVDHAQLSHGDVVRIGEVEITYAETTRNPASLGPSVEYASALKSFGSPVSAVGDSGEATILGLMDAPGGGEDFEVRPAGEFAYDLHDMDAPGARDLDAELGTLEADPVDGLDFGDAGAVPASPPASPAPAGADVWELEEEVAAPEPAGPPKKAQGVTLTLEIEGLAGDLRRLVAGFAGKVIELPPLRVRIKGDDLE